ncbi:class I histocompatibility antigen, F10 alpha chain-like isoform X4 [Hyperolius riggenbachi]|uniref:class I histocompatibility antigen, F10 alpha chain-like isoform X4 n=1 Tax=Hyperolius riggenbachi TaxID=752182 RepID=UPI0035A2DA3E
MKPAAAYGGLLLPDLFSPTFYLGPWKMKMSPLILLFLGVSGVYCDSHSLQYYYTAVSAPGSGLPVVSVVGYVDDREITNYNSDTRRDLPKTEWMKKLEPEYWEYNTHMAQTNEAVMKNNVETVMHRFNQTGGIHYYQSVYGCELRDDGSTAGYQQVGYDGRDFMYLDTQSWLWIPAMQEAQLSTQRWNDPEERVGERNKKYLETECIDWLKRHINNGRKDLERRVRPEVKVWGRQQPDGVTRLQCLAYGFHPRAVDVKWVRNGEDHIPSDEASPILPHPDGTYQTRVSVEVPTREGDTYSCHVDHSSLEEPITVTWDPNTESEDKMCIVIGVVVTLAIVIAAAGIGVLVWRRRSGKHAGGAAASIYVPAPEKTSGPVTGNNYTPAPRKHLNSDSDDSLGKNSNSDSDESVEKDENSSNSSDTPLIPSV